MPGSAKAVVPGADHLELRETRRAQRVARVHVRFDDPQPLEQSFGARNRFVGQTTTELLRIVDMRVEDAGQRELAAGIDDIGVRITRRNFLRLADGDDLVAADCDGAVADDAPIAIDGHHIVGILDEHIRHLTPL